MVRLLRLFEEVFKLDSYNKDSFVLALLIFLLIFEISADFVGWKKLIKSKEKNITFFEIPEINLKTNLKINPEDFLDLFYLVFLLDHLLKNQIEKFLRRKKQLCKQKFLRQAWN